jgi:hypothetical protein
MTLHIQSKELILPLILIQGLDHVHEHDAGVKWSLDLDKKSVQELDIIVL